MAKKKSVVNMSPQGDMKKTKSKIYDPNCPQNNLLAANVREIQAKKMWNGILVVVVIILAVGNAIQATQQKLIPVIVTVDKNTGQVDNMGLLNQVAYTASDVQIQSMLSNLVSSTQSVTQDQTAYGNAITKAEFFLNKNATSKLVSFIQNSQIPQILKQGFTTSVIVNSVVRVSGTSDTWQVNYTIQYYDSNGNPTGQSLMLGTFTVTQSKPKTQAGLMANPLGLVVTDLNITNQQNISPTPSTTPSATPNN